MAKYSVPFTTWANISVEVEVPDNVTDPQEIVELAQEADQGTSLCRQCGGSRNNGLEIGDDFEPVMEEKPDGQQVPIVTRLGG